MSNKVFKIVVLFLVCICHAPSCLSQDILSLKNGTQLVGKVTDINEKRIRFIPTEMPDSVKEIYKTEVFLIRYANGTQDVLGKVDFSQPSNMENNFYNATDSMEEVERKQQRLLILEEKLNQTIKKYRQEKKRGIITAAIGMPALLIGIGLTIIAHEQEVRVFKLDSYIDNYYPNNFQLYVAGPSLIALGAPLSIVGATKLSSIPFYKARIKSLQNTNESEADFQVNLRNDLDEYHQKMKRGTILTSLGAFVFGTGVGAGSYALYFYYNQSEAMTKKRDMLPWQIVGAVAAVHGLPLLIAGACQIGAAQRIKRHLADHKTAMNISPFFLPTAYSGGKGFSAGLTLNFHF